MGEARAALAAAAARLAFSATPRLDAELLLAHALGIPRDRLLLTLDDHRVPPGFAALVERRVAHEPIAYLTGQRGFWTIDLAVGPGALVPRADSETLLAAAAQHFRGTPGPAAILDLGCGPGTLLLAALDEWPAARGIGIDVSPIALDQARANAVRLGMAERADLRLGDWADGIAGRFDLVLANPPYVAAGAALPPEVRDWEPHGALFAGADGLDAYRTIAPQLPARIADGGVACIEIGCDQGETAAALFRAVGLAVSVDRDLGGRDRCLVVRP